MEAITLPGTLCGTCHEPLAADGSCLSCQLRGALEGTLPEESTFAASPPPAPSILAYGDFEIARRDDGSLWELGRGAMGVTYKATDRVLHRPVALKVIQFGPAASAAAEGRHAATLRERFLREARAAASLRHAHVAGVYQFGAAAQANRCFYAMELIEGETLQARVRRDGPLDVSTALEVARQVTTALVAAAGRGLIHRDLKPGNLMLTDGGNSPAEVEVKVIDFGLAKATAAVGEDDLTHGGFVGTPAFASPEQFDRHTLDARTDLYSLGVTLWFALTGRTPFTGRSLEELRDDPGRRRLPLGQLTARKVPACVVALMERVLALDPAGRPASARELLDALDACRVQLGATGTPDEPPRRLVAVAVAVAAVMLLAAAGGVWRWAHPSKTAADQRTAAVGPETPPAPPVSDKSVAVLPFDNFSEDKDSAFFADGVQDEILTDLAKVTELKVISRSSVMQYKAAQQRNVREIGKALGVAYIIEGSVQRASNKIRVTAQLIDARTDTHQWAEHCDRDVSDVFAMQSEIAQAIADKLRSNLSLQ